MKSNSTPILIVGGGIGGIASALALTKQGFAVKVFEKSPVLGEIGAGVQFGPNAFAAMDGLGVGENARARAVMTEDMRMHDALDGSIIGFIPTGQEFLDYFGNPYAVCHRADVHTTLLEGAKANSSIEVLTGTEIVNIEQDAKGVTVTDQHGNQHSGLAMIGADGVKSVVRQKYVHDQVRVSGHVVYRAVVDKKDFPADLQINTAAIWVGPNYHLVHYPLRGGEQYNVVVTFHSRNQEEWSVTEGSKAEVETYFQEIDSRPRRLIDLPKSWKRWATADRNPIRHWTFGNSTLLGDAAHVTLQYMAQGACMAIEDAVTLGEALRVNHTIDTLDFPKAFKMYERARVARTAKIVLMSRFMGKVYHQMGEGRLERNRLWQSLTPQQYYEKSKWLYGWKVDNCLVPQAH